MPSNIRHFIELLLAMAEKEIKVRYKNTTLGFIWAILYPAVQALIIGFVFQFFYRGTESNYGYVLFLNLLVWNFFSLTVGQATSSIVHNRSIVKKASFPFAAIPLAIAVSNATHLIASMVLFTAVAMLAGTVHGVRIPAIAGGFLLLMVFTSGVCLITASLNVRKRDVNFLTNAALMIWFYATPIVYSLAVIPTRLVYLWHFNPLTAVVELFQYGYYGTPVQLSVIGANTLLIVMVFGIGLWVYGKLKDYFDDYI